MTVKALIERLSVYPGDWKVHMLTGGLSMPVERLIRTTQAAADRALVLLVED